MKKNLLLLFIFLNILSYPLLAQKKSKTPTGFGIEAGLGYNTTKLTVKKPSGEDTTFSFIHVWFQPSIRLHYDIKLYQMGVNSVLKLKTLLGYYSFGGKLKPDKSGKSEVLTFGSIEAGVGLAFDVYHMFEITPMIKTQYIFSATDHLIISTPTTAKDLIKSTKTFSSNAGLQLRYKIKHITLGIEGWYGLANFRKADGGCEKENNYRFMFGYEF